MKITRQTIDTMKGSADWFTGDVYVDAAVVPEADSRASGGIVHFAPGARTAWHTHPHGQTIFILEGVGRVQRKGGPVETVSSGDRVYFEPGEEHWHGAAPNRFMAHLAILQTGEDGTSTTWLEHVTDEEYGQTPAS